MKTGKAPDRDRAAASYGPLAQTSANQQVIRASMKRWQSHNKYGLSIGRGLSASELVDKVAGETGASKKYIRSSIKKAV